MHEMERPESNVEVRLRNVEQRLESLEQVGREGLPAIRLTAIEVRLNHLDDGQRKLEEGVRDLKVDMDRRFDNLGRQLLIVTLPLGLLIAILQVVTIVTSRT